jgi:hypothetical protein
MVVDEFSRAVRAFFSWKKISHLVFHSSLIILRQHAEQRI